MLLTAAHCVADYRNGNLDFPKVGSTKPKKVFYDPTFFTFAEGALAAVDYDLAVVVYPEHTGQSAGVQYYPSITAALPRSQTPVTIVGYGLTEQADINSNSAGEKYVGVNTVSFHANRNRILINGPCFTTSGGQEHSIPASGDSGGPLIIGSGTSWQVAGVVSSGSCSNSMNDPAYYASVNSAISLATIQKALEQATGPDGNGEPTVSTGWLCGQATANTKACINPQRNLITLFRNQPGQTVTYIVEQDGPSQMFPGATAFYGTANMSFISGMSAQQQLSFIIHPNGTAKLVYMTTQGWKLFGGTDKFEVKVE